MDSRPIFEWDERKRCGNLRKHKLDFADCAAVFSGVTITAVDDRYDYGETRFLSFGLLRGGVVVVVHTEAGGMIRVISMRKAAAHEQKAYFEKAFQD
jgi:uncharacterized DUF497 family protein